MSRCAFVLNIATVSCSILFLHFLAFGPLSLTTFNNRPIEHCHRPSMGIGSKSVKTFVAKVPWSKVIEKAGGAKDRGDRLWPSRNSKNDSTLNFRLDKGSTDSKTGNIEIILQANKNAEDPEVKKAAQKD
ncbi:hypothetical protein BDV33DRAFT_185723, partial [Aspergillus novoparasiticus]